MTSLQDLVHRTIPPKPWSEGDNIPWHQAAFSERMLAEHLSGAHDLASRRPERIEKQVDWIHQTLLQRRRSRVLDLGCGPGLYTSRLTQRGHRCTGIDYSPASLRYARDQAARLELDIEYHQADLRETEFGLDFDLCLLIYGELAVFQPHEAAGILSRVVACLQPGGLLVLEFHPFEAIRGKGQQPSTWSSARRGLFSEKPHLCLQESFWDSQTNAATVRYFIVDANHGQVTRHAVSYQAYLKPELEDLLSSCGFSGFRSFPSLTGTEDGSSDLEVLVARRSPGTL